MTGPAGETAAERAGYRHRAAGLLQSAANDLKRDAVNAARDLGLPEAAYRELLAGQAEPDCS